MILSTIITGRSVLVRVGIVDRGVAVVARVEVLALIPRVVPLDAPRNVDGAAG